MDRGVDVIIPVYKPDNKFRQLIKALDRQSIRPNKLIIINTERKFYELANLDGFLSKTSLSYEVHHISKQDFDHGRSRNMGVRYGSSEVFVCMTMDAVPADKYFLEKLIEPVSEDVAMSYSRQLPYRGTGIIESFTRRYNYPDKSYIKSLKDGARYGIKLYFASNVSAAYHRKRFETLGGFDEGVILNEDMLYGAKLINSGGSIAYVAEAKVYHSHEYSGLQQFKRNFDIGVSQTMYRDVFAGFKSESEGIKLVRKTGAHLIGMGKWYMVIKLIYISACKYLGYALGKRYDKLPIGIIPALSLNRMYWRMKI